ncbi:MAG: amidohydrolase [Hyphomicrobiales bacterium]|nr:amidohydrolase [Hyphomicrobiales bacterium]
MPLNNRIADLADDVKLWRRDLHMNPEILYEVHRTAGVVAQKLREFGCDEVVTGLGRTGVVGVIHGNSRASGRAIGLRADMDALPIHETTGLPHASLVPGKMHACGHDGHTSMLLGAARYLTETRNFNGTAVVIFQPAEEGGAGGRAMIEDGLMDRFRIEEIFGMHNAPGLPLGWFSIRKGPILAATDNFDIVIEGRGGHAAKPHDTIDPVVVGAQIVLALQSIVARNIDPLDRCVVSVTRFQVGDAYNVIAQTCTLSGTVRTLLPVTRKNVERRMRDLAEGIAAAFGAKATVIYRTGYPVTSNHDAQTDFALDVARDVAGADRVLPDMAPIMAGEDFSYMLLERPGAFIFVGNGDSASLHHPAYDFNDEALPVGMSYWARLVETALPA